MLWNGLETMIVLMRCFHIFIFSITYFCNSNHKKSVEAVFKGLQVDWAIGSPAESVTA
jgi:hypothetical protein